jgi:hypothetical protein
MRLSSTYGLRGDGAKQIVSIIDHKILVKPMTIDPLVHFQAMVSIHRSEIDSPIIIFLNEREPSKSILQQKAAVNTMV